MNEKKYFLISKITDYLDFLENIKGLSANTIKSYQRDLIKFSHFSEAANVASFDMFTEEICSSWIADLFQQNVSARSIQRHISSAKGFFEYAQKNTLINGSPFELINSPKSPTYLPNVLSPEDVEQLLNFKPKNIQDGLVCDLKIRINKNGRILSVDLVKSSGNIRFDNSAIKAVNRVETFNFFDRLDISIYQDNFRNVTLTFNPQ